MPTGSHSGAIALEKRAQWSPSHQVQLASLINNVETREGKCCGWERAAW